MYMVSKNIVSNLCGYCWEAVRSIVSFWIWLHRIGFTLEFKTLF